MSLNWVYVVLFAVTVGESSASLPVRSACPTRPFLAYNVAGAMVWGTGAVLLGYVAGEAAIETVESASVLTPLLVTAVGVIGYLVHRQRRTTVVTKLVATIDDR